VNRKGEDPVLRRVREVMQRYGWNVTAVGADPASGTPPFAYTTGLWGAYRHPELLITALPARYAQLILNDAGALIAAGRRLAGGTTQPHLANAPLLVRDLDPAQRRFAQGVTRAVYGAPVPARQLVWPDPAGRYPGDPACDPRMAALQDPSRAPGPLPEPGT
jgi:hypothetical protein